MDLWLLSTLEYDGVNPIGIYSSLTLAQEAAATEWGSPITWQGVEGDSCFGDHGYIIYGYTLDEMPEPMKHLSRKH